MERLALQSVARKAGRGVLIALAILLAGLLLLVGVLLAVSPGKPEPYLDADGKPLAGSISEKIRVQINGVEQGMFIKGKDRKNPVLLFVHGGPGMPEYAPLVEKLPPGLEDYFTVCYWEQRGAGLSYGADLPPETLTLEQLVSDTLEVTNYLRRRFGQEKIYLLGHSWGAYLAIQVAARAPELYHAYIAMQQISRQMESEKLAYAYMVEQYRRAGNKRMLRKFARIPLLEMDRMPNSYRALRDEGMHLLGIGTTHKMKSVISGVFLPVWQSRAYTLGEKINVWRGKWSAHSTAMWNRVLAEDLTSVVPKLEIPVYFFHGAHDYTVSYPLAKDYFEKLLAPRKGFYTFPESAHSPLFEEPERARRILTEDVLAGATNLADRP